MILQKFFTDTLGGRYIKSLLSQTPVPTLPCVCFNEYIVKDCYYFYKDSIIQCTHSGALNQNYRVISLSNSNDAKTFSTYQSPSNYYDPETHYQLGRYLRYIKSSRDLNLLSFYNCYTANYVNDVEFFRNSDNSINSRRTNNVKKKVVAVPIRFNAEYTIAIDSPTEVMMGATFRDNYGYIDMTELSKSSEHDVTEIINNSNIAYTNMIFSRPVKFSLNLETLDTDAKRQFCAQRERYLYLIIQLDISNNSSIVVLENVNTGVHCDAESVIKYDGYKPFLLSNNYNTSFAFSNRLIEYLLNNVIHSQEWYGKNISKVQTALRSQFDDYNSSFVTQKHHLGIYDNQISECVMRLVNQYSEQDNIYDQDGNINVDIEKILLSKGSDY